MKGISNVEPNINLQKIRQERIFGLQQNSIEKNIVSKKQTGLNEKRNTNYKGKNFDPNF